MAQKLNDWLASRPINTSVDQLKAQARQRFQERSVGRKAAEINLSTKPTSVWDVDETMTYELGPKSAALGEVYNLPKGTNPKVSAWTDWMPHLRNDIAEPKMAAAFRAQRAAGTHNMVILTARSRRTSKITEKFLKDNDLKPDLLLMRPVDKKMKLFGKRTNLKASKDLDWENMSSAPYKVNMLDRYLPQANVTHFFDDHKGIIEAMKNRGIPNATLVPSVSLSQDEAVASTVRRLSAEMLQQRPRGSGSIVMNALEAAKSITHAIARI